MKVSIYIDLIQQGNDARAWMEDKAYVWEQNGIKKDFLGGGWR